MWMNNHEMANTLQFSVGFIDSGTTFTYIPETLFTILYAHITAFCQASTQHCLGGVVPDPNSRSICFSYNENKFS